MGVKRGTGRGAFIDSVLNWFDTFCGDVVQHLKAWAAAAAPPKMRDAVPPVPAEPPVLTSTALSSPDGPEPVEAPAASPHSDW